jgi:hypothetical protein
VWGRDLWARERRGCEVGGLETLWVNLTNVALGAIVVLCWAAVVGAVALELRQRFLRRLAARARLEDPFFDVPGPFAFPDHQRDFRRAPAGP